MAANMTGVTHILNGRRIGRFANRKTLNNDQLDAADEGEEHEILSIRNPDESTITEPWGDWLDYSKPITIAYRHEAADKVLVGSLTAPFGD